MELTLRQEAAIKAATTTDKKRTNLQDYTAKDKIISPARTQGTNSKFQKILQYSEVKNSLSPEPRNLKDRNVVILRNVSALRKGRDYSFVEYDKLSNSSPENRIELVKTEGRKKRA